MGRYERHDADYFPFYAKDGRTLFILEDKYGCKGTGFFTNILRFLTLQPDHYFCIADPGDRMYFFSKTKCDETSGMDMIGIMVKTGKLDADLWGKKSVIASKDHLNSVQDAYKNRKNACITIDEIKTLFGITYVRNTQEGVKPEEEKQNIDIKDEISCESSVRNTQTKLKYTKLKYTKEKDISSELQKNEAHEPPASPILEIPLISKNGKIKTFPIFQKDIDQWKSVFPALDVLARIKLIRQWNIDNPQRRKTARGIKQHITSWLERDQNSGKFKPSAGAGSNIANLNKMALLILECDGAENFERYCIENGLDAKQLKVPP